MLTWWFLYRISFEYLNEFRWKLPIKIFEFLKTGEIVSDTLQFSIFHGEIENTIIRQLIEGET